LAGGLSVRRSKTGRILECADGVESTVFDEYPNILDSKFRRGKTLRRFFRALG